MKLRYVPTAQLWHGGSKTFGSKRTTTYQYYFTRNGLLWLERYASLPLRLPLAMRFLSEARGRVKRLGRTPGERAALARATRIGIRDYVCRRFGQGQAIPANESGDA